MLFSLAGLSLLAAAVQAAPYARRGLAEIKSNCNHGFAYTFDDGPYVYHDEIRTAFDNVQSKTTFFVNGDNWSCIYDQANVDRLRRSYEAGHQIALHTWSHAHLPQLSNAQIDVEIQRLDAALVKILGVRPKYLRPPYGDIDERSASYIQQTYGKKIVLWSDDSGDSTGGTTQQSYDFYNNLANQGGTHMTLSHETADAGIGAIRQGSVTTLNNHGIKSITVGQCLDDSDLYEFVGGYGTRDATWTCGGTFTPTPPGGGSTPTTPPPSQTCVAQYTSVAGDTCDSIGAKYFITGSEILAANSFLNCNDIWANTPICVPRIGSGTSSTTAPPQPSCVSTYTSVANDTCDSIGTKFGLSGSAILAANSFLNCNDIWVNTPICIPPGGQSTQCTLTISSQAGDTCNSIGAQYGVSGSQILAWNSFLNCNDIWTNTPVCVRH